MLFAYFTRVKTSYIRHVGPNSNPIWLLVACLHLVIVLCLSCLRGVLYVLLWSVSIHRSILRVLLLDNALKHFVPLVSQINLTQVCLLIFFLLYWMLRAEMRITLCVEWVGRFTKLVVRLSLLKLSDVTVHVRMLTHGPILLLNVNAEATSPISYRQICRFLFNLACNVLAKSLLGRVQSRSNKISFNFHGFISRNFSVRERFVKFGAQYTCFEFVLVWCSYSHIFEGGWVGFAMGWLHVESLVFICMVVRITSVILFLYYLLSLVIWIINGLANKTQIQTLSILRKVGTSLTALWVDRIFEGGVVSLGEDRSDPILDVLAEDLHLAGFGSHTQIRSLIWIWLAVRTDLVQVCRILRGIAMLLLLLLVQHVLGFLFG